MQLRPYQRAAIDAVFSWVTAHDGHPLLVIPTGGGKSLVMGVLIAEALAVYPAGRALVLAHRKELISQNVRAITTAMPLGRIGIYSAGLNRKDRTDPVIVGGIQSIARDPFSLGAFDLVCIDEAHLVPESDDTMYRETIDALRTLNPHVRFIGLTATPYRMGSGMLHRGESALFTEIAYEAKIPELIAGGYLCPLISRATAEKLSTEGVGTRGGEFIPGQLERAVDLDDTNAAVAAEMTRLLGARRKWLVFCAGVRHAEHVAAALRDRGIAAAAVHGELDAGERASRLAAFRAGELRAVTSMDILTTGFDEPAIDAVVLLRPTKSTGLYVQMVGRGFRLHPSKENTLVLDFAENVAQHGPVDEIEVREPRAGEGGPSSVPTKECPRCSTILHAATRVCPVCGFEFQVAIVPVASSAPVLSTEREPEWDPVTEIAYARHEKPDKPPSLRVEYYCGWNRIASEWICLEHGGYARQRAESWWRARAGALVPETVDEALELSPKLRKPAAIATVPDGRWRRVVSFRFADELPARDSALPQACWSCGHWSERDKVCLKFNMTPPVDVQADGCEHWAEEAELPF